MPRLPPYGFVTRSRTMIAFCGRPYIVSFGIRFARAASACALTLLSYESGRVAVHKVN